MMGREEEEKNRRESQKHSAKKIRKREGKTRNELEENQEKTGEIQVKRERISTG